MDMRRVLLAGLFNFSLAVHRRPVRRHPDVRRRRSASTRSSGSFWLDAARPPASRSRDLVLAHQIVAAIAGTVAADPARHRHRARPHPAARIWLPPRPHRDRPSPPPRPADPDRRHHPGEAGPGGDPRHRPDPRALRLVRAQAAEPRPGRRQGRPCRRPARPRGRGRRRSSPTLGWPAAPDRRSWRRVSRAYVCSFAASACSPLARCSPTVAVLLRAGSLGLAVAGRDRRRCIADPLARLAAHPLRARRRPAAVPRPAGGGSGRSILPLAQDPERRPRREFRRAAPSASARCGSASPAAAAFPIITSLRLPAPKPRARCARELLVTERMSFACGVERVGDAASRGAGGARAATSLAATWSTSCCWRAGSSDADLARHRTPTIRDFLPDPSVFADMDKAAARLADAVEARRDHRHLRRL